MNRTVIHIDITDFYIAVERVLEPKLRQRPVAIAVQTATRSIISSASQEARSNHVFSGMPLTQAKRYCPDLVVLTPNEELYVRATTAMLKILSRFSPIIEPLRFGHAYLDMSGSGKLFGPVKDAAAKAQREIRESLRLKANAGIAGNKMVSKVASDVVTNAGELNSLCDVPHGNEQNFLAPLKIGFLPGVKKDVRQHLWDLNIHIIRQLSFVSAENLQMVFGKLGLVLYQRAHGIDNRPVQPPKRAPEIVENQTLTQDCNDHQVLYAILFRLLTQGTRRLRNQKLFCQRLLVQVNYSDDKTDIAQKRFLPTHDDYALGLYVDETLKKALSRRVRVRKLTLKLCDLVQESPQLSLFTEPKNSKKAALTEAMDKIRDRFGEHAIFLGKAA